MSSTLTALKQENPFLSLFNPSDINHNFHLLSSSFIFKDLPSSPPYDEDLSNLFEEIFLSHVPTIGMNAIPKILHVIWLGPNKYPLKSTERLKTWVDLHPEWELYFWTDEDISLPHEKAKRKKAYVLPELKSYYDQVHNFGESSDLVRISILHDLGGLYFDHDITCLRRMDPITASSSFMIACEYPGECGEFHYLDHKTAIVKKSSFSITNALIASSPSHPVWNFIIQVLKEDWEYFSTHPDFDAHQKTMHRTYLPFTKGIIAFDPRKDSSFALLPSLFHAPFLATRNTEAIFEKIKGWIFALNHYESLWKQS